MKTIYKKLTATQIKKYDFDNEFSYLEKRCNSVLTDCYFAEKEFLNPDGSIKNGGRKYFYCNDRNKPSKEIVSLDYKNFDQFDCLYFFDENGEILNIKY